MIDNIPERRTVGGEVDFTMMYIAHDAFARHLEWIATALEHDDRTARPRWAMFAKQLHIHHTAEDDGLWPVLRAQVASPNELAVLDAMEEEHGQLDPQLSTIEAQLRDGFDVEAARSVRALAAGLAWHMRHEENDALPLIDSYLGQTGWAEFGNRMRSTQGLSGAAEYLPWVLDGAPAESAKQLLAVLPAPARVAYRTVWRRRYQTMFA